MCRFQSQRCGMIRCGNHPAHRCIHPADGLIRARTLPAIVAVIQVPLICRMSAVLEPTPSESGGKHQARYPKGIFNGAEVISGNRRCIAADNCCAQIILSAVQGDSSAITGLVIPEFRLAEPDAFPAHQTETAAAVPCCVAGEDSAISDLGIFHRQKSTAAIRRLAARNCHAGEIDPGAAAVDIQIDASAAGIFQGGTICDLSAGDVHLHRTGCIGQKRAAAPGCGWNSSGSRLRTPGTGSSRYYPLPWRRRD